MSETKHTPGPWRVVGPKQRRFGYEIVTGREIAFAEVRGTTIQIAEANARLIAASPTLLEACKTALASITGGSRCADYLRSDKTTLRQLVAAIARAERGTTE